MAELAWALPRLPELSRSFFDPGVEGSAQPASHGTSFGSTSRLLPFKPVCNLVCQGCHGALGQGSKDTSSWHSASLTQEGHSNICLISWFFDGVGQHEGLARVAGAEATLFPQQALMRHRPYVSPAILYHHSFLACATGALST
eukprot:scaffold42791_cov14-Tisochrysis_lutea.AAC.1